MSLYAGHVVAGLYRHDAAIGHGGESGELHLGIFPRCEEFLRVAAVVVVGGCAPEVGTQGAILVDKLVSVGLVAVHQAGLFAEFYGEIIAGYADEVAVRF